MKRARLAAVLALGSGAVGLLNAPVADAAETSAPAAPARRHVPLPGADGVYGRLDGNLALGLAAGAELEANEPRGVLRFSAHYLWTAGVYARYSDAFGGADERPVRVLSLGIDVRPLFLPRFALDAEQGPATLDLALDSIALTAGAFFAQPRGLALGDERGFETGLGVGLPLLGRASGPWLQARAERRFADRGPNAWLATLELCFQALTWSTDPGPR